MSKYRGGVEELREVGNEVTLFFLPHDFPPSSVNIEVARRALAWQLWR